MNLLRTFFLTILILALASCGGPATTTANKNTSYEFKRLCLAVGAQDNRITRDQFMAVAKDKESAGQLFDACDVNRTGYITENEVASNSVYFESLKAQVHMFQTPRP
jgi:hypothetical protein